MSKKLHFLLIATLLLAPFTLHSTDIYTSSHGEVRIHANLNPQIVPEDPKLGSTVLVVSAPTDKKDIHIVTPCKHKESVLFRESLKNRKTIYIIQLTFRESCGTTDISIGDMENVFTDSRFPLPMKPFWKVENRLMNTDSSRLLETMRKETILVSEKKDTDIRKKLAQLQMIYRNLSIDLESGIARGILNDREDTKYFSPVVGYGLPNKDKLIPGTGRPYRKDTTDGIHHGWDIMAPIGTPVQSLAKGKIIRIVNDWNWGKFHALKRRSPTEDDKLRNLDIYRGNQVWLQTMDGNVTFYSHLSKISRDIAVGTIVDARTYLGNIGVTGVPEKNYKDVHLHFEIQQNPFHEDMKNPTYLEIMRWDYMGKSMKKSDIYAKMREIFG